MERRKDLDFAKGIGIMLMVLGHCYSAGNGEKILRWLYSFHMPLFFIIPGIVYSKNDRYRTAGAFGIATGKIRSILTPYFFFATATAAVLCVLGRKTTADFAQYMWRIVTLQGINAMWFLPCFLFAELLFIGAIRRKHPKRSNLLLAAAGMAAVCFPVLRQGAPMLQRTVIGAAFLALGYLLAERYGKPVSFPVWAGCATVHLAAALLNQRADLEYGIYGDPLLYFLNGLLGTFVVIRVCDWLEKTKCGQFFVWLGKHTIVVLCTSSLVIEVLRLLDHKLFRGALPALGFAEGLVLCVMTMAAEIGMILFCSKYLWFALGKPKKKIHEGSENRPQE